MGFVSILNHHLREYYWEHFPIIKQEKSKVISTQSMRKIMFFGMFKSIDWQPRWSATQTKIGNLSHLKTFPIQVKGTTKRKLPKKESVTHQVTFLLRQNISFTVENQGCTSLLRLYCCRCSPCYFFYGTLIIPSPHQVQVNPSREFTGTGIKKKTP